MRSAEPIDQLNPSRQASRTPAKAQIAALCSCSFTNAYLVISVFPYAGFMVMDLIPSATTQNAGLYAGLISGSFFAARFFTAYQWGRLGDSWGRVRTLELALTLSGIFSILFGFSKSLAVAILWRGCLGASNCLISTTKTLATELAETSGETNEKLQRRTMGLVVGMRSWGLLCAPAIAGFLAEPLVQYPRFFAESGQSSIAWKLLATYPFSLPNLFGALCCLFAVVAIHILLRETLQNENDERLVTEGTGSEDCESSSSSFAADCAPEKSPLLQKNGGMSSRRQQSAWSRPLTRSHMVAHWLFSIVSTYVDEAFPLFCISVTGGLGLRESDIGKILTGAGILFAILQYITFALMTHWFGLYKSMGIGCLFGTLPAAFMPLAILLRGSSHKNWWFIPFLSFVIGTTKLFHSLYFTSMAVAINKTVDSTQRARMNALVLTGNSIAKAIGPSIAGLLVTLSYSEVMFPARYGSLFIWSLVPCMGVVVGFRICLLRRQVQATTNTNP